MPSNNGNNETIPQAPKTSHVAVYILVFLLVFFVGVSGYLLYNTYTSPKSDTKSMTKAASTPQLSIPKDAVKISGCISHEGEHWVQPQNLPNGPFYVAYNNKVLAFEYMLSADQIPGNDIAHMTPEQSMKYLQDNKLSLSDFVHQLDKTYELPTSSLKDFSIHWTPPHAGFVVPHYDIHFYVVDKAERDQVCPAATFDQILPADMVQDLKQRGIAVPQ